MEILAILLFISIFLLILYGYPVAFTLGGISVLYALCFLDPLTFTALPPRIMGIMSNYVLLAVPLFIFMGIMLEKSGLAESLLETMAMLFGRLKGGLAISVVIVGALLAASTGIVGATVVTMGLISLPTMLKRGYKPELATGTIAASGTLGQIIPPSVVLVLLGSVLNVSVGQLFAAALLPGLLLVLAYILYIIIVARLNPRIAPSMPEEEIRAFRGEGFWGKVLKAFLLPLFLIVAVLGSIFAGIASPTEAAAVGAMGATLLTVLQGKFSLDVLKVVSRETTHLTSMVFVILLGATVFSFVFREMEGDVYLVSLIRNSNLSPMGFLALVMVVVFVAGFFIDFIEIIFIIVPVVAPIFIELNIDLIWIGVLLGLNLQTSFLSPPFGFSLFYLKGVAPPGITTAHLYRGIVPFVLIQLLFLLVVILFPGILYFFIQ
ncbi:MAG: TRAP transporter large permease subunit [Phaeodactylibacter sp.]|nr:TRAP transporter large permease subunit [Phaeodactylibacter sp.]MCB9303425.1 TRAP transporter large permease subunit [Lewinellaceae bacterium]